MINYRKELKNNSKTTISIKRGGVEYTMCIEGTLRNRLTGKVIEVYSNDLNGYAVWKVITAVSVKSSGRDFKRTKTITIKQKELFKLFWVDKNMQSVFSKLVVKDHGKPIILSNLSGYTRPDIGYIRDREDLVWQYKDGSLRAYRGHGVRDMYVTTCFIRSRFLIQVTHTGEKVFELLTGDDVTDHIKERGHVDATGTYWEYATLVKIPC